MAKSKQDSAATIEVATTNPEEAPFLNEIVDNIRDDAPKLVYADWLEDQGDGRFGFIRQLVAAANDPDNESFPDARPYPRSWTAMLGAQLLEGIPKHNLTPMKDAVLKLARPIVVIESKKVRESRIPVGSSKFGGRPDLPSDVDWPSCELGLLNFVCQINLHELAGSQISTQLPRTGLLSMFVYQNSQTGIQPGVHKIEGMTQLFYSTGNLSRRKAPPTIDPELGIRPACRLSMWESWDLPDDVESVNADDRKRFSEIEEYCEQYREDYKLGLLRRDLDPLHNSYLMGYPRHYRCSGAPNAGPTRTHLLSLSSDDQPGWCWCDGDRICVHVETDNINDNSFRRAYGYCG